jgi:phenylacetate-CoA ligase
MSTTTILNKTKSTDSEGTANGLSIFKNLLLLLLSKILMTGLWLHGLLRGFTLRIPPLMIILYLPGFEKWRWNIGRLRLWKNARLAQRQVPAYKRFLRETPSPFNMEALPETDKNNYIRPNSLHELCRFGKLPAEGVVIDESSGSSGVATSWARGLHERENNRRMMSFAVNRLLGKESKFILNAFALGPWATGINVSNAFSRSSIIKSLGPDIAKIRSTLEQFGKKPHYLVMGYPPFLKSMTDEIAIEWKEYNVDFIYGGEGMSLNMRNYLLQKGIKKIYSSFGASDLELNIAAENDFTIALRDHLFANPETARRLLKFGGSLPMVFQYNPMDFFMEVNKNDELVVSLCRPGYLSPRIRYNIHDRAEIMRFPELLKKLKEAGIKAVDIGKPVCDLPLLFHYGRSDNSVSFYGCKIFPQDVQEALYGMPETAGSICSFSLHGYEDENADNRLAILLECADEIPDSKHSEETSQKLLTALGRVNQDFRESLRIAPRDKKPQVKFYKPGEGVFAGRDVRIKHKYII